MKKFNLCVISICILSFLLCGCYDSKEIDETAYIIALGIDKNINDDFNYTFQLSAPLATMNSEGSKGGAEGDLKENPTVRNIVISAPDFYTAKNMTNNFLSKTVDMSHLKLIVFSKEIDKDVFLSHSQFLLKEREIRPNTNVALAKDSAEDYLKSVNPELEANTAKYYELQSIRSNNVYAPSKTLSAFVDEISSNNGVSVLPVASTSSTRLNETKFLQQSNWISSDTSKIKSNRSEMRGIAIFKHGNAEYIENGDFAMIYNILTRNIRNCTVTFKNPYNEKNNISFRLTIPKTAVYSVNNTKKPCRISISQGFNIEYFGGFLPEGFSTYDELYHYADWILTSQFTKFFEDLSKGKQVDIMNIGNCVKKQFLTMDQWNPSEWENSFNSAEFNIEVYFI